MIDFNKLNEEDFESYINTLSQDNLNSLLFESIDCLWDRKKIELLLQKGADANYLVKDGVMLWTIAFSRDLITFEKYTITDILISYIFDIFTKEFQEQCKNELIKSLNHYNHIMNKSNMYYNNLGYETKKGKELLDKEYEIIVEKFADKIVNIYESIK